MYENRLGQGWEISINNLLLILCIKALLRRDIRVNGVPVLLLIIVGVSSVMI